MCFETRDTAHGPGVRPTSFVMSPCCVIVKPPNRRDHSAPFPTVMDGFGKNAITCGSGYVAREAGS